MGQLGTTRVASILGGRKGGKAMNHQGFVNSGMTKAGKVGNHEGFVNFGM